jgi:glutamate-1-semialdehyde 2,1-aminomutase
LNTDISKQLYHEACGLMPAGVNSPVRAFKSVGGEPLFISRGKGSKIFDEDGNSYVDYCMSWGPLILGHADEDVISAVKTAAENGTSFGAPNRHEIDLAHVVIESFSSIEMLRFVNSGTEAVMSAVRLARGYTGRDIIVKFDGCYHGHADHMLVAAGSGLATFSVPDSAGVPKGAVSDTVIMPFNDFERIKNLADKQHDRIAAIILEPVPCNYGLIPADIEFITGIRELCDRYGILLIFDEVITGFRLARGGAQEYFNIRADITTLGKIIGGGLPVGAYGASKKIMGKISPLGPVYQAGTLSGNPLAMRAGLATLKKINSFGFYSELSLKSRQFSSMMESVIEPYKNRIKFICLESIFVIYFTETDKIRSIDDVKKCDMPTFAKFHSEMLSRGIYMSPSGYEVGFISSAHSLNDLEFTAGAVSASLKSILN